ncbi:MAG: hypothetical protein H6Q72_4782 [Firmicutes bacterium]|nr:hypothetical protein [Bacillota bacterium]
MAEKVDADLYEFLRNHECQLYRNKHEEIIAWVVVPFSDLDNLAKILGYGAFDDGGIEVHMMSGYIALELNEIFESYGNSISDYKNCFGEYDDYFGKGEC